MLIVFYYNYIIVLLKETVQVSLWFLMITMGVVTMGVVTMGVVTMGVETDYNTKLFKLLRQTFSIS